MSLREEMDYLDEAIHFGKDSPLYLLVTLSTLTSSALVTLLVAGLSKGRGLFWLPFRRQEFAGKSGTVKPHEPGVL